MKTNKRPELVLSLIGIAALAREALATTVQKRLFAQGFQWKPAHRGDRGQTPVNLQADWIRLNSHGWNRRRMTCGLGPIPCPDNDSSVVFDAATQLEEFFAATENVLEESCEPLAGIKVTVRPSGVQVDASELLAHLENEGEKVREAFYGRISSVEEDTENAVGQMVENLRALFGI